VAETSHSTVSITLIEEIRYLMEMRMVYENCTISNLLRRGRSDHWHTDVPRYADVDLCELMVVHLLSGRIAVAFDLMLLLVGCMLPYRLCAFPDPGMDLLL
jgi:hypothetical protein